MGRPQCKEDENIIRAIRSSDWDEKHNRWSSNLFRGPKTSVSRLKILSMEDVFTIFCKDLHKPPVHKVIKGGEINVGQLKRIGLEYEQNGKPKSTIISVEEDPLFNHPVLMDNPAHAEIVNKLTRTLAFNIINALTFHKPPPCNKLNIGGSVVAIAVIITILVAAVTYLGGM